MSRHGDAPVTDGRDGVHQGHGLLVVHAARGLVQDQQAGSEARARAISSRRWLP